MRKPLSGWAAGGAKAARTAPCGQRVKSRPGREVLPSQAPPLGRVPLSCGAPAASVMQGDRRELLWGEFLVAA